MYTLSRKEHFEAISWGIILAIFTSLPYITGYISSPDNKYFLGFVLNPGDSNTYFMWMTQVSGGAIFLKNLYTSIPHDGAMLNFVFVFAGWLAKIFNSLDLAYQLLRVIAVITLTWSSWYFTALFFENTERRRWAVLLVVFGSGLGWTWNIYRLFSGDYGNTIVDTDLLNRPLDLWVPEGYVFYSMLVMPHFTLAIAFLMLTVRYAASGLLQNNIIHTATAGVFCFVLSFVHPYDVLIALGLTGTVTALFSWQQRKIDLNIWRHVILLFMISVGPILYNYWILHSNPGMNAWLVQNKSGSPAPWSYISGYGLLLLGALAYLIQNRRQIGRDLSPTQWLFAWLLLLPLALYAPIDFQRRLVIGASIPLALLTILWIFAYLDSAKTAQRKKHALILIAAIAFMSLSSAFHWLNSFRKATDYNGEMFIDRELAKTLEIISLIENPQDLTVMSRFSIGNHIPRFTGKTTVIGSRGQTGNFDYLLEKTNDFFEGQLPLDDANQLLKQQRVGWLVLDINQDSGLLRQQINDLPLKELSLTDQKQYRIYRIIN